MEHYDWDIELASAHQLGVNAGSIVENRAYNVIAELFNDECEVLSVDLLVEEMCRQIDREYERNSALVGAFVEGFLR